MGFFPGWHMRTKGEIEAAISHAIVQFEIDYMGRGPKETRTHIVEELVVVRLKGVLTLAEEQLTQSSDGNELVKKMRSTLIDKARPLLYPVIGNITGTKILCNCHSDASLTHKSMSRSLAETRLGRFRNSHHGRMF
jgi:uncharacterized protein YbcI